MRAADQVLGRPLLHSGNSLAAHYREASRAKSNRDFVSKMDGALQELDETDLWLDLLVQSNIFKPARVEPLRNETDKLIAICVTTNMKVKLRR